MNITNTMIETVSGRLVDLADPKPDDILATDIAWSLSREPRFGGHTITKLPYTVLQHSVAVADIIRDAFDPKSDIHSAAYNYFVQKDDREVVGFLQQVPSLQVRFGIVLFGLLHDASEAYLRDLPSPVKSLPGLSEAYKKVEAKLMDIILTKYGVYQMITSDHQSIAEQIVHWADLYARTIEAYHFMPSRGQHWLSNQKVSIVDLQRFELPKDPVIVYQEFLDYLEELSR